ncbi:MAG TPA: TerC family protein, partial [Terrimesophilobacter sp.]|nr:TerC family protein [Terrimesophilobacter sp.]
MTTTLPLWFEITSLVVLSLIILFDLILAFRRPHIPSVKESTAWVSFYVTLALVFGVIMYFVSGVEYAGQFIAGWLTEYSLSIDNLFVFIII